jgi:hypothetical protein
VRCCMATLDANSDSHRDLKSQKKEPTAVSRLAIGRRCQRAASSAEESIRAKIRWLAMQSELSSLPHS